MVIAINLSNISLLVFDLDGTLLNRAGKISSESVKQIINCHNKNFQLAIATGRNYFAARKMINSSFPDNFFKNFTFITCNGASIYRNDRLIASARLKPSLGSKLLAAADDSALLPLFYTPEEIIFSRKHKPLLLLILLWGQLLSPGGSLFKMAKELPRSLAAYYRELKYLNDLTVAKPANYVDKQKINPDRIYIMAKQKALTHNLNSWHQKFSGINFINTHKNVLEVQHQDANKGRALELLLDNIGIKPDEVLVFGDGHNDISMFARAGQSVIMENSSSDRLQSLADYTARSNDKNGVAHFLHNSLNNMD